MPKVDIQAVYVRDVYLPEIKRLAEGNMATDSADETTSNSAGEMTDESEDNMTDGSEDHMTVDSEDDVRCRRKSKTKAEARGFTTELPRRSKRFKGDS